MRLKLDNAREKGFRDMYMAVKTLHKVATVFVQSFPNCFLWTTSQSPKKLLFVLHTLDTPTIFLLSHPWWSWYNGTGTSKRGKSNKVGRSCFIILLNKLLWELPWARHGWLEEMKRVLTGHPMKREQSSSHFRKKPGYRLSVKVQGSTAQGRHHGSHNFKLYSGTLKQKK